MSKLRIHELAKDYGMAGKDLAAKLRGLGFSQVKSHMTALDEFEVIQVQGILEDAYGPRFHSRPLLRQMVSEEGCHGFLPVY